MKASQGNIGKGVQVAASMWQSVYYLCVFTNNWLNHWTGRDGLYHEWMSLVMNNSLEMLTVCWQCWLLWVDTVGNPITGVSHSVINTRLTWLGTAVACWHQAYQGPSSIVFHHQRTSAVSLTRVLATAVVTSAHHLVVDDHVNPLLPVPLLALPVVDHGHVHHLQGLGSQPAARFQSSPTCRPPIVTH